MAVLLNKTTHPPTEVGTAAAPKGLRRILGFGLDSGRVRRWTTFLVLFLVADALIAIVAIALVSNDSKTTPQPQAAATLPASTPTLALSGPAAWMNRELPHTAGVLATDTMRAQLVRAGFGKVLGADGVTPSQVQYVVSNAELRSAAEKNAVLAQLLAYSAPIAAFGDGADQVVVRQTTSTPQATRAAHHAAGLRQRAAQERQLLENKRLHFNADGTQVVRNGALDMRAASVLALLADAAPLQVQIVVDPAERAAGVPARQLLIRSSAPDKAHEVLAALPATYRLASDQQLSNGLERLVWPIDPDPAVPN
jgi:hypothetical protein